MRCKAFFKCNMHAPTCLIVSQARGPVRFGTAGRAVSGAKAARSAHAQLALEPTTDNRKKISMVQLGCPKNTVDGEVMLGDLARAGFDVTEDHNEADAVVVNTCAFVEEAKTESLEAIMEAAQLKADGSAQRVIVTGCLAQRYSQDLAEQIPEADMVLGFQNYSELPRHLRGMLGLSPASDEATHSSRSQVGEATVPFRPEYERHRLTPKHTAYLRVAEGCNHACTFCAIPGFRSALMPYCA